MDSIYIVTKNKEVKQMETLSKLMMCIFKSRYLVTTSSYLDGVLFPFFKIHKEEIHLNEDKIEMYPNIWVNLFRENYIYVEDGNFPIIHNQKEFFPLISLRCRESLFVLEFLVLVMADNSDWLVCNVNNELLSVEDLRVYLLEKNYGWAY